MILGIGWSGFAPVTDGHVIGSLPPLREPGSGKVGDLKEKIPLFRVEFSCGAAEFLHLVGESLYLSLETGRIGTGFFQTAYFLAETIFFGAKVLDAGLALTAAGIAGKDLVDQIGIIAGTCRKTGLYGRCIFPNESDIKHGEKLKTKDLRLKAKRIARNGEARSR
jgi:hypothetical protein